ncbi:MAG: hypothetical protein JWO56_3562 [Acidobacteria bacterium]|nr:hypothetical protein [Acidobacteriota bacterium]
MHDVILRIFFSGLMAFVPSQDGKELTVLVVNTSHDMKLADGQPLPHHTAILLARASACEPAPCPARDASIAKLLFAGTTGERAADSLQNAVGGGGAWVLASSDLSLPGATAPLDIRANARGRTAKGSLQSVPTTPNERADFSWVPHLTAIAPAIGEIKPELLGKHPPAALVAARLRLRSGSIITYSMIRVDGKVRPIHFNIAPGAPDVPFAQALANWVEAEIHVPGDAVELVETNFQTGATRTIKLRPQGNVVELAVLNFPPFVAPAPGSKQPLPRRGQHFEVYYDLMTAPPAKGQRPVPDLPAVMNASDPQADWAPLHPQEPWSDLLDRLGMNPRGKKKSPYDLSLCPGARIP